MIASAAQSSDFAFRAQSQPTFTPYHSQYLADRATLLGVDEDAFTKSLSTAKVDMNPHQVDAALFALQSPLAKGVPCRRSWAG